MNMLRENMRLIAECSQQLVRLGENLWGKEQKLDKVEPLDIPTMTTDFVKEHGLPCPDGYIFKDENGNVINAQKIVLEKKKKEYPKTYEECCVDLGLKVCPKVKVSIGDTPTYREHIVETFIELLACRDAYLKRYEIEMKLNSRWTPDYEDLNTTKFCITTSRDKVIKVESSVQNYVLAFPTEEMRDAFYKNFKSEIERCKELL